MASGTSLVGNAKVMAHLVPNLVPPIDRRYTLSFLFGNASIRNDLEAEWMTLAEILRGFFYPIVLSPDFRRKIKKWAKHSRKFRWDTSPLKIVDNLVIGLSRSKGGGKKTPRIGGRKVRS
jgi:hypothetical protein